VLVRNFELSGGWGAFLVEPRVEFRRSGGCIATTRVAIHRQRFRARAEAIPHSACVRMRREQDVAWQRGDRGDASAKLRYSAGMLGSSEYLAMLFFARAPGPRRAARRVSGCSVRGDVVEVLVRVDDVANILQLEAEPEDVRFDQRRRFSSVAVDQQMSVRRRNQNRAQSACRRTRCCCRIRETAAQVCSNQRPHGSALPFRSRLRNRRARLRARSTRV